MNVNTIYTEDEIMVRKSKQQGKLTFNDFIRFQFVIQQSFFLPFEVDRRKKNKGSKCTGALQHMKCMIYGRSTIYFGFGANPYF